MPLLVFALMKKGGDTIETVLGCQCGTDEENNSTHGQESEVAGASTGDKQHGKQHKANGNRTTEIRLQSNQEDDRPDDYQVGKNTVEKFVNPPDFLRQ
jgi:hypothetical protein